MICTGHLILIYYLVFVGLPNAPWPSGIAICFFFKIQRLHWTFVLHTAILAPPYTYPIGVLGHDGERMVWPLASTRIVCIFMCDYVMHKNAPVPPI